MEVSQEKLQQVVNYYLTYIPRLSWFSPERQIALVLEAAQNAPSLNQSFSETLESLTFTRSFTEGERPSLAP